eukprot:Blabericola_migrator_1__3076@NODE_189_length_11671_cov_137_497242_g164_i0_p5_GENE_NODE_189_length_11671_cov_137_497242_g164_i0NODE_189_length_11671_cov_137_497242_g164_i0_p5_ORF_typecomplete_len368_score55_19ArfGap/PF01412_18/9_6e27_NODE_189_length_11671_cov_137_497242_g164_i046345737
MTPKALSLTCDDKGYVTDIVRDKAVQSIKAQGENRICFDCGNRNTAWISTSFAIFMCVQCSGKHRNLGPKVSFVRSLDLDRLQLEEILKLEIGGNGRAKQYFRSHGSVEVIDYRSKAAEKYARLLGKEVEELLLEHRPELLKQAAVAAEPVPTDVIDTSTQAASSESSVPPTTERTSMLPARDPQLLQPSMSTRMTVAQHFSGGGHAVRPKLKVRTDEFDFDFESAFSAGQRDSTPAAAPVPQPTPSLPQEPSAIPSMSGAPNLAVLKDATKAKSFSNADFDPHTQTNGADLTRFRDATAISSDAFFHPGENGGNNVLYDEGTGTRIALYSDKAVQKVTDLASAAQESIRSAAAWFSRVSSTPPGGL